MVSIINKIKNFPKRLLFQIIFFLLQNPLFGNFFTGTIYQGSIKKICTPGLNCYSCPAAISSCPIGALQNSIAGVKYDFSLFVTGFLLSTGVIFGRFICGYVCPMGLFQDLIYKIRTPKKKTQLRYAKYLKYFVLVFLIIALPYVIRHELSGLGDPWFCKYICPSGMIFGALPLMAVNSFLRDMAGMLFTYRVILTIGIILISLFIYRFFCRVLCPLGAIYSLFNKIAFVKMHFNKDNCTSCKKCREECKICIDPSETVNSPECVRCGDCIKVCPGKALKNYRRWLL